ncbi:serine/threonine-protein kinase 11-interacting protein isoform X2 [Periplaneta americana]|uniref:serine/threonine-protein kinase 11-interacting protein isoform X2 n=1 Tax=Periplaneta americana TaxID=6978 RepID=UPI0037E7979B
MEMNDISNLAALLRENGDKVLNGQSKLSLTVSLLKNLNDAFTLIVENEEVNNSFQVINTNNSKVEIFHEIQFLHDFVQKTIGLKIGNSVVPNNSDKGTLDICKFRSLRYLELKKVPVHLLSGIQSVRAQLQSIVCIRCIQRLEDLLLDCGADHSSGFVWSDLREAVFSYNGIDLLDRSLGFTPWLQILDLSHNRIYNAEAIACLPNLKYLNMSYNLLESVPVVNKDACKKLQVLVMKNNYIEELSGLLGMESLMELDLSCNCLADHDSLNPILHLPSLTWLSLEGNPLSFHTQHRILTARHLHDNTATGKFMMDRLLLSKSERLAVGSMGGGGVMHRTSFKDDNSSAGSSSASERTLTADRGGQMFTKYQQARSNKKSSRVREAVISEQEDAGEESDLSSSFMTNSLDLSTDHLETKKQIETLRERFGEENWLHSHAGFCVQDVLGLHKTAAVSTDIPSPVKVDMGTSPRWGNIISTTSHTNKSESSTADILTQSPKIAKGGRIREEKSFSPEDRAEVNSEVSKAVLEVEKTECEETIDDDDDDDDDEEDEGEEQLYLVQRQRRGGLETDEFFLVVTDKGLKEREVLCGRTLERWTMSSLLSCVQIGSENQTSSVQLTFDTVRRDRQERIYILDRKDAQKLVRALGKILESRPLTAMNQVAYRCMKCSTQFSQEVPPSGVGEKIFTCPTCNSTLVIQMDEVPLPAQHRDNQIEKQVAAAESGPPSSGFNSSPSQSSIGSAASLDPFTDSPNNTGQPVKRWDSDIEIISNPSQSSIEVLDEHSRLQGSATPSRKRSSEERQVVSVTVPPQHPVVSEIGNHMMTLTGLTESSSSGSLTDSICTTYEIHSVSVPSRQEITSTKPEDGGIAATLKEEDSVDSKQNGTLNKVTEKLAKDSSNNDALEDESPTQLFKMHEENLSPRKNYASMLEGLLQSVGSKLISKSPEKSIDHSEMRENVSGNDRVKYSYIDFSAVDHRVKLYLYLHLFQQEQEDLLFLLRAQIIPFSSNSSYPGCFIVSTKNIYILEVIGEEGDDPEQWLRTVQARPIETLKALFPLMWQQGVGVELLCEEAELSSSFLLILQDQSHTINFFSFLAGVTLPKQCRIEQEVTEKQTLTLQQALLSSAASDDVDPNITLCAVSSNCEVTRNEESSSLGMGVIIVTPTDILLIADNLEWLFRESSVAPTVHSVQKMSNLIEVEMDDYCRLTLNFLDEVASSDESWTLKLGTESTSKALLSAIRKPWEQLFSVPLQIVNKNV